MKWVLRIGMIAAVASILFALLLPWTGGTSCGNPNARDENTAYNLKNAISAYFMEYREYPLRSPGLDITVDTRGRLLDILLGSDAEKRPDGRNLRGIAFYTDKAAKPKDDGRYRRGVTRDPLGGGELWDSWGNPYLVRFDTTFDNKIENPESPGILLPQSILVWSAGKDGDFETWEDNVKTW